MLYRSRLPYAKNHTATIANEYLDIDFRDDPSQGFGVPAKSIYIRNDGGGGAGDIHIRLSADGSNFSSEIILAANEDMGFDVEDGVIIWSASIKIITAGSKVIVNAAPGYWTEEELAEYDSAYGGV